MDDIAKKIIARGIACHMSFICTGIFLYTDDLFVLAPSVHTLQIMLNLCETELSWLDMRSNVNKSVCMRFWQRFDIQYANLITDSGDELKWVEECRYLGVYLVNARRFKCSWRNAKCPFYRAFNAIFGRLGRSASSEVVLHLVRSKCIPVLLYGLDACPINTTDFKSLQHPITNILMKMFATKSAEVVTECQQTFWFQPIRNQIDC